MWVRKEINDLEHTVLLWNIGNLPFESSKSMNKEINELYSKYQKQLQEMTKTVNEYEKAVAKIKKKVAV